MNFADSIGIDSNRQNLHGPRHSPDGMEGSAQDEENRELVASLFTYEIPYRCLVPQRVDGLIAAGRAISANHDADGYTRNQPACMVTGQAAGVAPRYRRGPAFRRVISTSSCCGDRCCAISGTKLHASELN